MKEGPERRAAALADAGIDAVNLHHTDWTGGLTTLFHRFEVLAFGWDAQHARILDELLDSGHRRGLLRPHRPMMDVDSARLRAHRRRPRALEAQTPPMSPGGHTRTKARPTIELSGIGPNMLLAFES